MQQACDLARESDAVLIYAGLPGYYESEGFDRASFSMPQNQVELIRRVAQVNPNVAVVLLCGSVVDLFWADEVTSILLMHLGGEAMGGAVADLVSGAVLPSPASSRRAGCCCFRIRRATRIFPATRGR